MPEIIGIDHVYLSVADPARSRAWYDRVLPCLGFRRNEFVIGGDPHVQYYNRRFGIVLRPARAAGPHDPYAPGLHHLCWRVDSAADVEAAAEALRQAGIEVEGPVAHPEYAPDYVAVFFRDPDGIRLEITNYRAERRERHDRWDELA